MEKKYLPIPDSIFIKNYNGYARTTILVIITLENIQSWLDALKDLSQTFVSKITLHDAKQQNYIVFTLSHKSNNITIDYDTRLDRLVVDFTNKHVNSCSSFYQNCLSDPLINDADIVIESENSSYEICFTYSKQTISK